MRKTSVFGVERRFTAASLALAAASLLSIASAFAAALPGGAGTSPIDCPMGREPYSSRSPLLDLLIDPRAQDILRQLVPSVLKPPVPQIESWSTEPPTFAAILTAAALLSLDTAGSARLAQLDAALGRLPITAQNVSARCARYDGRAPVLPRHIDRPALLVFEKITGFRDEPSVAAAHSALTAIAQHRGWGLVFTDNGAVFNRHDLARFDLVVWNNVSGDALTLSQRKSFREWMQRGGGFAGIHGSGGDPVYFWDWYADELVGARFKGHPMDPQFQEAQVVIPADAGAIAAGIKEGWRMTEEWYSFTSDPQAHGAHVLARLDESSYTPVGFGGIDLRMGNHPIAWTKCLADGRSFYTAIGHRPESYAEPHSVALLEAGILWAAGRGATHCRAGSEVPR